MKLLRNAALLAAPAALSLAACGGGSSSPFFNNATQGSAQVRFLQADPKIAGAVDIYFFQSAASQTTNPASGNVPFGVPTDFQQQTAVPNTLIARAAGSGSSSMAITACNLPPLSSGVVYSVVIADQNGTPNCMIFQDAAYTSPLQYRFHHAAADAAVAGGVSYGVGTSAAAFTAQGTSSAGGFVGSTNPITQAGVSGNLANATGSVFAFGPSATPGTPRATLSSTAIFAPGGTTQPDVTGVLPQAPYPGVSLFAIDCVAPIAATTPIPCNAGVALVGVFDTK